MYVEFTAPSTPGQYQSHWRLAQSGQQFGHRVWCNIIVDPAEILEPKVEPTEMQQPQIVIPATVSKRSGKQECVG